MLTGRIYRPEGNHPSEWQKDLNPDANAGVNYGQSGPPERTPGHTAHDVKSAHRMLQDFSDDELRQIFATAPHVVTETFTQNRYLPVPLEPRGVLASWEP